jgi:hypothetical protein
LSSLETVEQAVLTTTDLKLFSPDFVDKAEVWQVKDGKVSEQ